MSVAINLNRERRQQAQHLVTELQQERHEVWSLYCQIAELKPFNGNTDIKLILKQFAEMLVDYVSLGHFGIYDRLLAGTERRESVLNNANAYYPEYSQTTEDVVSFNDRYDPDRKTLDLTDLEADLSRLGESLAKRMEIEDNLCNLLIHREQR